MAVLVVNSGSSSIKFEIIDPENGACSTRGLVERIGNSMGHYLLYFGEKKLSLYEPIPSHEHGMERILNLIDELSPNLEELDITAVGHRVVQGGKYFDKAVLIDDTVERHIQELIPLAPLHNPAHLRGIHIARKLLPVPHVAVFDTAFFRHLPPESAYYALNSEIAEKYEILRYGAHGTSHQYAADKVCRMLGRRDLKQIIFHLGNGASASAVVGEKAVDTSMGLTPLEGLVMGTRTGDIDPAVAFHLQRIAGMSSVEVDELFNRRSGMKGLTGDSDMRVIWKRAQAGEEICQRALQIYIHRILHYVGAYTAVMGGLDTITFTAGIGEKDDLLRAAVLDRLASFGIRYSAELNAEKSKEARTISTEDSKVRVLVVPAHEELAIARQVMEVIS